MNTSFYNGISGVKAQQFGLDVWANNIANIGTMGFRGSTPEFSSLFSTMMSGGGMEPIMNDSGMGAQSQTTGLSLTQGVLENTDNPFDLAISGEGWFGVQAQDGNTYYTRAGEFSIDTNGNLVDPSGNYLMATSGSNIAPTTLSQDKLDQFGKYYQQADSTYTQITPSAITPLGNVPLGSVGGQTKVTLPDYLYFPAIATTYVNYQANLNPKITTETSTTTLNALNNVIVTSTYPTASISGTMANNTDIANLKEGDTITIALKDSNNNSISLQTTLDASLNFQITDADISKLENSAISIGNELQVTQEIPNVEHFTTDVIASDGGKNILDMTFTKRVPQQETQTIWDVDVKVLRFFEDYKIENYNPLIHNTTDYDIDLTKNQAVKKYDPALYQVDVGQKKVYQIIDAQNGVVTFGDIGQILTNTIPSLSNSGTPLNIDIGIPYLQQSVSVASSGVVGSNFVLSGTVPLSTTDDGIHAGENVAITMTDTDGEMITTSAKIAEDGSWKAIYENYSLNTTTPIIDAYVVINTGFEGMISNVDLDKARLANKDGLAEGFLTGYGMDGNGNVIAEFSNGRSSAIAKVALYHFQNDQGLQNVTSTLFSVSSNSGQPIFYTDADGTFLGSKIYSNKLEGSNVSMATALTELIITQKAFDASAKSITTSDQMIQNAINMKK